MEKIRSQKTDFIKLLKFLSTTFLFVIFWFAGCKKKDLLGYFENDSLYIPVFSLKAGQYDSTQVCSLSVEEEFAEILFTTDSSTPDVRSILYQEPIIVNKNMRINARTYHEGDWVSQTITRDYTFEVKMPLAVPASGVFSTNQKVALSCASPGAVIRYTLDSLMPTENSPPFTGSIPITDNVRINARAFIPGWNPSDILTEEYSFNRVTPPVFQPEAGEYNSPVNASLINPAPGIMVRFTLDGSEPNDQNGTLYQGPIIIAKSSILKARAFAPGMMPSEVVKTQYDIIVSAGPAKRPAITPNGGTHIGGVFAEITSSVADARIRYTTNSTEPDENSALYQKPIPITHSLNLKAITTHPSYTPSSTTTARFIIATPPPDFSPPPGIYPGPQKVILKVPGQPEAMIYYTLDGSAPDIHSNVYSKPIHIKAPTTIKAFASDFLQKSSAVKSAAYVLKVPVISLQVKHVVVTMGSPAVAPVITWNPPNATDKTYQLQFTASGIAQAVDGKIAPLNPGMVIGTVISGDGQKSAQFIVIVQPR